MQRISAAVLAQGELHVVGVTEHLDIDLEDNLPRSESERPLEGPDGDMDRDGIPNAQDPRPLYPDREFEARVSEEDGRKLEGPDGDMDGDGIPNAQDPNPLIKD